MDRRELGCCRGRLLKKAANEAAGETKPEAYPLGYVEDFDEPRTPLADFLSILLSSALFEGRQVFHRFPSCRTGFDRRI